MRKRALDLFLHGRWNHSRIAEGVWKTKQVWGLKWQRESIRELSLSRMAYSYRTRCDSKASPVRLAGDWSRISMGTNWVEKSAKRDGPSSGWLVKSERPSSVLTNKRRSAGQSSKSWRAQSRRNLIPWKSCEWPRRRRNVSWECVM